MFIKCSKVISPDLHVSEIKVLPAKRNENSRFARIPTLFFFINILEIFEYVSGKKQTINLIQTQFKPIVLYIIIEGVQNWNTPSEQISNKNLKPI